MLTTRFVIGQGEGKVVGCSDCGEVETLFAEAVHRCNAASHPTACTISSQRVAAVEASPTLLLASPASKPSLRAVMLAAPLHD